MSKHDNSLTDDEVPREPHLRELYDDLPHSAPPMHLDARILAAAREAAAPTAARTHRRPFSRHWAWPVSLVALMVLSVSVVVLVQPQVGMQDAILLPEDSDSMVPLESGALPAMRSLPAPQPAASPPATQERARGNGAATKNAADSASPRVPVSEPTSAAQRETPTTGAGAGARRQLEEARRRGAQQALERDAVRERLRAARNESQKREAATQRRAELKLLLDEAERVESKRQAVPSGQPRTRMAPKESTSGQPGAGQAAPGQAAPSQAPARTTLPREALSGQTSPAQKALSIESEAQPDTRKSGDASTPTPPQSAPTPSVAPAAAPASRALRSPAPTAPKAHEQRTRKDASGTDLTGRTTAPQTQRAPADAVTREFARIRALLDNGEIELARNVYESLLRKYPGLAVPQDIRARLE